MYDIYTCDISVDPCYAGCADGGASQQVGL